MEDTEGTEFGTERLRVPLTSPFGTERLRESSLRDLRASVVKKVLL